MINNSIWKNKIKQEMPGKRRTKDQKRREKENEIKERAK